MDKWGRKAGVIYCSSLGIVGGILLCAAQGPAMFIVFRFVAGAGSWGFFALSASPSPGVISFPASKEAKSRTQSRCIHQSWRRRIFADSLSE